MGHNIIGHNSMDRNMREHTSMGQEAMRRNMIKGNIMGRNIYNIMSNRGMTVDASNMITGNVMGKQQMNSKIMDQDLSSSIIHSNMLGQHEQPCNVIQHDELQHWTHGPAHDAEDEDGAYPRGAHFNHILLKIFPINQASSHCVQNIV